MKKTVLLSSLRKMRVTTGFVRSPSALASSISISASDAPCLTNELSSFDLPRCSEDQPSPRQIAQTSVLFPVPFGPMIMFRLGPRWNSAAVYVTKFLSLTRMIEPGWKASSTVVLLAGRWRTALDGLGLSDASRA